MVVLPHTALWVLLVLMISWVAEDRGFELLYPSLQVLGKIMSKLFLAFEPHPSEDVQQNFTFHI